MSTLLTIAAFAVGGLVALALGVLGLLALGLWIRTYRLTRRGQQPQPPREAILDTDEIPAIEEESAA